MITFIGVWNTIKVIFESKIVNLDVFTQFTRGPKGDNDMHNGCFGSRYLAKDASKHPNSIWSLKRRS